MYFIVCGDHGKQQPLPNQRPIVCPLCGGDGWVEAGQWGAIKLRAKEEEQHDSEREHAVSRAASR